MYWLFLFIATLGQQRAGVVVVAFLPPTTQRQVTIAQPSSSSSNTIHQIFHTPPCPTWRNGSMMISSTTTSSCRRSYSSSSSSLTSRARLSAVGSGVGSILSTLHADPSYCLTGILLLSTAGITLEKRTTVGKALSAPLATMALALTVANIGMMPFESTLYKTINSFLVPLAVPMLLFDSDLRRVWRDTGSLLACFGVGAIATVVGTLVAFPLLPLTSLGGNQGTIHDTRSPIPDMVNFSTFSHR